MWRRAADISRQVRECPQAASRSRSCWSPLPCSPPPRREAWPRTRGPAARGVKRPSRRNCTSGRSMCSRHWSRSSRWRAISGAAAAPRPSLRGTFLRPRQGAASSWCDGSTCPCRRFAPGRCPASREGAASSTGRMYWPSAGSPRGWPRHRNAAVPNGWAPRPGPERAHCTGGATRTGQPAPHRGARNCAT